MKELSIGSIVKHIFDITFLYNTSLFAWSSLFDICLTVLLRVNEWAYLS